MKMSYASHVTNNQHHFLFAISALIISISIGYYFVIYIPHRDKEKLDYERNIQIIKTMEDKATLKNREECLQDAEIRGSEFWDSECEGQGLKKDCRLPTYNADRVDSHIKDAKNECFKKYPQN